MAAVQGGVAVVADREQHEHVLGAYFIFLADPGAVDVGSAFHHHQLNGHLINDSRAISNFV